MQPNNNKTNINSQNSPKRTGSNTGYTSPRAGTTSQQF